MKKYLILIAFLSPFTTFCQDRVILKSEEELYVKIKKSGKEAIEYVLPEESTVNVMEKDQIRYIRYESGRIENISRIVELKTVNGEADWENVLITYLQDDVIGLDEIEVITKSSLWGGKSALGIGYSQALEKIKKEAAKLKASVVLITKYPVKETVGMSVKLTGIAY